MSSKYKYIYGPVPSRRLGLSLGVDIIPLKTCTQNCLYCQLCIDQSPIGEPAKFVTPEEISEEIKRKLAEKTQIDCVTLSGSGEPTLNIQIGQIISEIKKLIDIPLVVITNGTLLWKKTVRDALLAADIVMPSLDACDQATFQLINRPHESITFDMFVQGLIDFRKQFKGKIWLEVFMVDGLNTSDEQIEKFKALIEKISPDRIQLNTAVRPTASPKARMISEQRINEIAAKFGDKAEIIAKFSKKAANLNPDSLVEKVIETLRRRPCSVEDLSASLGAEREQIEEQIAILLKKVIVRSEIRDSGTYYILN